MEGDTPIADQILDHQAEWGCKHQLSWSNSADRSNLRDIARRPPMHKHGWKQKRIPRPHKKLNRGNTTHICESVPEEDDNWNRTEWCPLMARTMILPERMGCEPTNNNTEKH